MGRTIYKTSIAILQPSYYYHVCYAVETERSGMAYYSYHGTVRRLIAEGKLIGHYFTDNHNGIKPALVLLFDDSKHPVMPIRQHKWEEYSMIWSKKAPPG